MRYYEIHTPECDTPKLATNVKRYRNLPEGTRVYRVTIYRGGDIIKREELPVDHGRVRFRRGNSIIQERRKQGE